MELKHSRLILRVRPGSSDDLKQAVLSHWYRVLVRAAVPELLAKWEPVLGVEADRLFVQKMKTRWGSCNPTARSIRLNTELAKKPAMCLEYIVVHELAHLLERRHNERFLGLMDACMPQWRRVRDQLNRSPLAHEEWGY